VGLLTTFSDKGVGNGRQYFYTILALDNENGLSANATVTNAWVANGGGNIKQTGPVVITTTTVAKDTMNFTMKNTTAAAITVSQDHHQRWWLEKCEPLKAVGKPTAT
jgi:hypothetical protein